MSLTQRSEQGAKAAAAISCLAAASYAAYVGYAWLRYGHPPAPAPGETDALLDRFMPDYDVVERHNLHVAAPADVTFAASMEMDLEDSRIIRAIFKGRQILLGADADAKTETRGLVAVTKALGWGVLADVPGRELVMGAVTQPWKANVVFRGLPPDQFAAFDEPGFVKIVWTLRADSLGADASIARTETRVVATDAAARRKFRWYWARFSPGIVLIREISIRLIKREAERRARLYRDSGSSIAIVVPPSGGTSI
jgi:hypothetical protein